MQQPTGIRVCMKKKSDFKNLKNPNPHYGLQKNEHNVFREELNSLQKEMMEGIGRGAKKTKDIIKRHFSRNYRNMAQLKDDRLMKCRISHKGQKTIWSGSALIYQHTHLHVDKNNTEDTVSTIN